MRERTGRVTFGTTTDLLRRVLTEANGNVKRAFAILHDSKDSCAHSARRVLRRTVDAHQGAYHVYYSGRGSFRATPPELRLVAVAADRTTKTALGPWDLERWGRLRTYGMMGCQLLDTIKDEIAPSAWILRVVNDIGETVAVAPRFHTADIAQPPHEVIP